MFQSLTGSTGHLAGGTRSEEVSGSEVSIPDGLHRPFSRGECHFTHNLAVWQLITSKNTRQGYAFRKCRDQKMPLLKPDRDLHLRAIIDKTADSPPIVSHPPIGTHSASDAS